MRLPDYTLLECSVAERIISLASSFPTEYPVLPAELSLD
jgi:hypothetical protein